MKIKLILGLISAFFFLSCEDHSEQILDSYWNFRAWDPNFKQYYLQKDILYFSNFSVTDNGTSFSIKINFNHTFKPDYVIKRKLNNKWQKLDNGGEFISVLEKGNAEIIRTDHVFGIFDMEKLVYEAPLTISFYPKEYYAANNYNAPGYLIFHKYDRYEIPFFRTPESWSLNAPTAEDRDFARREWGGLISGINDPLEQARLIQLDISKKLYKYQGVPSSELTNMSPFDQYKKLLQGSDRLWCAGWSYIFKHALSCFNIPARQAWFGNVIDGASKPNLVLAEGHSTVEIFDKNSITWKLVDLNFFMLNIQYQNRSLNTFDLHYLINNPQYVNEIYVIEYDPENNQEHQIRLLDSQHFQSYLNYYKVNQNIWFN